MSGQALLETKMLTKHFPGVVANEGINFVLEEGEVHCLFGENGAGKSTLCSCLFGYYRPDGGSIEFKGEPVKFRSPRDSIRYGIGMVHQHFVLVDEFTVLENIIVGTNTEKWSLDLEASENQLKNICDEYGIDLKFNSLVRDLSVGEQQWVEILKSLYLKVEILILDEPTAVLTPEESNKLFKIMHKMGQNGISIIFISHKISEVMLADRVSVMSKGRLIDTVFPRETTPQELTNLMIGREVKLRVIEENDNEYDRSYPILSINNLKYKNKYGKFALNDISLNLYSGEILGLSGVSGNGQKELFESLSGNLNPDSGTISYEGKEIQGRSSRVFMDLGIGLIPDDRYREGLVSDFDISENIILGWQRLNDYTKGFFLNRNNIKRLAEDLIKKFNIMTPSSTVPVSHLSGGNAQKVILARELNHSNKILLANQPTRGLDLGVIEYVYNQIKLKRDEGFAVLLASEELEDLINLCDRIAIISDGEIKGIVEAKSTSIQDIGLLMAGQSETSA
jgi:simple sugar transport system ATP-binding protein